MNQKELVCNIIKKNELDAVLFYSTENRFWYSDFISTLGYLLVTKENSYLFVDGRYFTEAKVKSKNVIVKKFNNIYQELNEILKELNIKKIGFESNFVTVSQLQDWENNVKNVNFKGINFHQLRMIKSQEEVKRIAKACEIGDLAFKEVLQNVKPGMKEKELENIILNSFSKHGATKPSFDTIVASGLRSSMPHGKASDKIINNNEIITCDFGCIYEGYCSDMTRTFSLGKISPELEKIHSIVKEAQMSGIKAVRPGIKIGIIDKICRDYIAEKGYNEYFTHGTGHGLGIEIHESPWVINNEETILEPGMVITVEPGIYVPGTGGVRIEDDILVTSTGYEILTKSDRDINVLSKE